MQWLDPPLKEHVFLWDIKEWHQADDYQCRYQIQLLSLVIKHFFIGNLLLRTSKFGSNPKSQVWGLKTEEV